MLEIDKKRAVVKEGVYLVCNGKGEVVAMLRRDPITKKHLVYFCKEGTCDDIAEKLIATSSFGDKLSTAI